MALRVTEATFAKDVFTRQKKNQRLRPSHLATQIDIWKQTKVTGTSSAYLAANSFQRIRTDPFQEPSPRENSEITKKPWQSKIKNNIWGSHKNVFKRDWLLDRQTLKKTTRLANPPWVLRKEDGTPYSYQLLDILTGTCLLL